MIGVFILVLTILIFLMPVGITIFYLIAGIRLVLQGKEEKSFILIKSGKTTVLNSLAALIITLVVAYFTIFKILSWEI